MQQYFIFGSSLPWVVPTQKPIRRMSSRINAALCCSSTFFFTPVDRVFLERSPLQWPRLVDIDQAQPRGVCADYIMYIHAYSKHFRQPRKGACYKFSLNLYVIFKIQSQALTGGHYSKGLNRCSAVLAAFLLIIITLQYLMRQVVWIEHTQIWNGN